MQACFPIRKLPMPIIGNCGMRLRSWLSLRIISKAFLRPSVQKYNISKVSAKKPPNRYKARKQSFPAENHRRNFLPENFLKIIDVTIDITSEACYIMPVRCN